MPVRGSSPHPESWASWCSCSGGSGDPGRGPSGGWVGGLDWDHMTGVKQGGPSTLASWDPQLDEMGAMFQGPVEADGRRTEGVWQAAVGQAGCSITWDLAKLEVTSHRVRAQMAIYLLLWTGNLSVLRSPTSEALVLPGHK